MHHRPFRHPRICQYEGRKFCTEHFQENTWCTFYFTGSAKTPLIVLGCTVVHIREMKGKFGIHFVYGSFHYCQQLGRRCHGSKRRNDTNWPPTNWPAINNSGSCGIWYLFLPSYVSYWSSTPLHSACAAKHGGRGSFDIVTYL